MNRRVVLYPKKWDPKEALRLIRKFNIGITTGPAAITQDLLREIKLQGGAPSLLELGGGGAPRPESQVFFSRYVHSQQFI